MAVPTVPSSSADEPPPDLRRTLAIPTDLDVRTTVRGAKNPVLVGPTEAWWSTRTPDGPGTLSLARRSGDHIEAEAWGPGAAWLLDQSPSLLGACDDLDGFEPTGPIRELWRRRPFRLARTDRVWDALIGAVLGQKVQTANAARARRALARRYGDRAPGPRPAWVLPAPADVAAMGYHQFHPLGVERKRADILIRVAREMPRIEPLFERARVVATDPDPDPATDPAIGPSDPTPSGDASAAGTGHDRPTPGELQRRLERIRGIGPWTTAMVTAVTLGDPDAVPVGDYHLPNTVAWLLAGEPRATDDRMLELLEPYAGHRWRVLRLAKASGSAPRYGPKLSLGGDGLRLGS